MPLITFFINRILEKENKEKNLILSYQCLNTIDNLDNDVKSYFYLHTTEAAGMLDISENVLDYYVKAKSVSNGFIKLVRYYKWKKARKYSWDTDICMTYKLDKLAKNQVVSILSNQTIYRFRISDIIIIWSEAILHRNGLFSEPQYPKNPHTNQYFKIHNLYNLYFSIFNSNFHMPLDIGAIFKVHFNIRSFKRYYLPLLRERILLIYYREASNYEIYEYILTMLEKFKHEIGSIYIPHLPTRQEKEQILTKMRHFVLLYLRATLSCNPTIRSENREKLILDLTVFIDDEDNSEIIYRIGRHRSSSILGNERPRISSSSSSTTITTITITILVL